MPPDPFIVDIWELIGLLFLLFLLIAIALKVYGIMKLRGSTCPHCGHSLSRAEPSYLYCSVCDMPFQRRGVRHHRTESPSKHHEDKLQS